MSFKSINYYKQGHVEQIQVTECKSLHIGRITTITATYIFRRHVLQNYAVTQLQERLTNNSLHPHQLCVCGFRPAFSKVPKLNLTFPTSLLYQQEAQLSQRETVRRFVSLNILLSHSRLFEMTMLSRACVSPY